MANIIPKLNLNKTPNLVESNSLVFAKNIRLDRDGSIRRDYGIFPLSISKKDELDSIKVNYKHIISRILKDIITTANINFVEKVRILNGETITDPLDINTKYYGGTYHIVGHISDSNSFYIFIYGSYKIDTIKGEETYTVNDTISIIVKYDEHLEKFSACNCNWNYSGGVITGYVINNLLGESILIIAESNAKKDVPLKCINLALCSATDDESLYTQTPNIPITNLKYINTFSYIIPNGVYQFFIRYKIRKDFYTDWFPASRELFAGNHNTIMTSFGSLRYINTNRSSDESFIFEVNHLYPIQTTYYQSFQIGFICSSDDAIVARAWKHFDFNTKVINFDYKDSDGYEIEISDITKYTYQLYNVENITSFKNKLYISNYKETNFNDIILQSKADSIKITIGQESAPSGYGGNEKVTTESSGKSLISGIKVNGSELNISGENGIIHQLLNTTNETEESYSNNTVYGIIKDALSETSTFANSHIDTSLHHFYIYVDSTSIESAKKSFELANPSPKFNHIFDNTIIAVKINGILLDLEDITANSILERIYNKNLYLNEDAKIVDAYNTPSGTFTIDIIRSCRYSTKSTNSTITTPKPFDPDSSVSEDTTTNIYNPGLENSTTEEIIVVTESSYTQTINISFKGDVTKLEESNTDTFVNYTTLVPYQKYKFYIHYVKQNGETTNGYYCGGAEAGIIEAPYRENANAIIYPIFSNIQIPNDYAGCFFSILHIEREVATVFNLKTEDTIGEANCIDINLGLYPGINNLYIRQTQTNEKTGESTEVVNGNGKYHYSSDSSEIRYFGADGIITYNKDVPFNTTNLAYLINEYSISNEENLQLIKCTPFIGKSNQNNKIQYSDYTNMNLLGFVCKIATLLRKRTTTYYTDGASVFLKSLETNSDTEEQYISIKELYNHIGDGTYAESVLALTLKPSSTINVYSNYNLNYLQLNEEPIEKFQSWYTGTSGDTNVEANNIVLRLLKSAIMSNVYTLPSMYKTYTRKLYTNYNTDDIIRFDNTIRSSELQGDENGINIFKFDANDYYNIPTNRGIIVNLESIGDAILVHTKDSMFKFTGSNTLTSSDGEIIPTESQPFDTGVSEMFGSDFGFGGLQYKSDSITTEQGYIFFDRDSDIIYMYDGNNGLTKISDSIEKLFRYKTIKTIHFANDYYNSRFFVSIIFKELKKQSLPPTILPDPDSPTYTIKEVYTPVTLSFNFSEVSKAFISLHDFAFDDAFNTKTKCYFVTGDKQDICYIDKTENLSSYTKLEISNDLLYPSKSTIKPIKLYNSDSLGTVEAYYNIRSFYSIVDVIVNDNYEHIKTLDSISWCSSIIESEFELINSTKDSTLNMAEDKLIESPGNYIRIYSDTCMTPRLPIGIKSNDYALAETGNYKFPRYNQGIWSLNYFRNILNANGNKEPYVSDENSLIEGKYFVVRFMFNDKFKLETLSLNYNNKL